MHSILAMAHLTLYETRRRRIVTAAVICASAFLAVYTAGLFFVHREQVRVSAPFLQQQATMALLSIAGLYAVNFLSILFAVLLPVDTLSGEIASGVIQTLAAKPIRRGEIVLGKWLGHGLVMTAYFLLVVGGELVVARAVGHFSPPNIAPGLALLLLEAVVMLSVAIAGGTRLSTITNGMMAFGLYGFAFIGNWMEQIGTFTDNVTARNVGTLSSLVMPTESLWNLACYQMQPTIMRELSVTPFSPVSVPSVAMIWWAVGYIVVALFLGLRAFRHRPL